MDANKIISRIIKKLLFSSTFGCNGYALLCRQQEACTRFEAMSEKAKEELKLQRERRVQHFQKSLSELAELEASCLSLLPL